MDRKQRRRRERAIEKLKAKGIETRNARVLVGTGNTNGMRMIRCTECGTIGWVPHDDAPPEYVSGVLCSACIDRVVE